MRTFPITNDTGIVVAFEIEGYETSLGAFASLLRDVPGVSDVKKRKLFTGTPDVHIRFAYHGREFFVIEPFGDNSRYWIGPDDIRTSTIDAGPICAAVRERRPSVFRRAIGLMLSPRTLFRR